MPFTSVSWSSEEEVDSTKLNTMAGNEDHNHDQLSRILIATRGTLEQIQSTSPNNYYNGKFYLPANSNTIRVYAYLNTDNASDTVYLRARVNANDTYKVVLSHTGDTDWTWISGTIDVSGLSEGWHDITFSLYGSNAGTFANALGVQAFLEE